MRWTLTEEPNKEVVHKLSKELSIDKILAKLLVQRGITSFLAAKKFFRPSLEDLYDPFIMKDMNLAVERIKTAISKSENILIYGDYDVDSHSGNGKQGHGDL